MIVLYVVHTSHPDHITSYTRNMSSLYYMEVGT